MRPVRRLVGVLMVAVLAAVGCTGDAEDAAELSDSESVEADGFPTSAGVERAVPRDDWHSGVYESPGYSCGDDPSAGCGVDPMLNLDSLWIGPWDHAFLEPGVLNSLDVNVSWKDPAERRELLSYEYPESVEEERLLGLGFRIEPVERSELPEGVDVVGDTFLDVTVSGVSVEDFVEGPVSRQVAVSPEQQHYMWSLRDDDPEAVLAELAEPDRLTIPESSVGAITEMVLIDHSDTMMEWIVGLRDPGPDPYFYSHDYWGFTSGFGLMIKVFQDK